MSSLLLILVASLCVVGVAICIFKPRYAIVPVLMLFPFEQILLGYVPELRGRYEWATNLMVGLIAVFGVAYYFFRGEKLFQGLNNRTFWCIMCLYGYAMLSIVWSPAPDSALYFLGRCWAYFFLLYLVSPLLVRTLDDLVSLNFPLIVVGVILMVLLLIHPNAKFINDRFTIDMGYQAGVGTVAGNPLAMADAGSTLAIICAIYRPNTPKPFYALLRWSGIGLGLTVALMSGSRGQVVAGLGVMALLAPLAVQSRNAFRMVGSLFVVGAAFGLLAFIYSNFLDASGTRRWEASTTSSGLEQRLDMALAALSAYGSNPLYWLPGLGSAAFNFYYPLRHEGLPHWYPHNIAIEAVTEYGVPGLVLFCGILFFTGQQTIRLIRLGANDRARYSTGVAMAGILIFQLLMSFKQGSLLVMPAFFMYAAIVTRVAKNEEIMAANTYANAVANGEIFSADDESQPEGPRNEWAADPDPA